jgi:tetratricopeptide (TPR) repeat protein
MPARIIFLSALLVLLTALWPPAFAQSGAHTLQGRVITPNGTQPRNPVKVTLTFAGRRIYETFTDLSGRFSFTGLANGSYQLTAEGDDQTFERTTVYAEVMAFGAAPQLFTQDIQLQPIRSKPAGRGAVVSAFTQDVPRAAIDALERAEKLDGEGKREPALRQYQEALRIFPNYFEARLALGNHLLNGGQFNEAIAELDRAREINPNDERLYQSFGLLLMQQGKYAVAVAVFAEGGRLNPTNPLNALLRGTALIYQAAALSATTPSSLTELKGLLENADRALAEANKLSDGKMKADHPTLSTLYELKGDFSRAASELEEYLRQAPAAANTTEIRNRIKRLQEAAAKARSSGP